jgi:dTDP-4-dehydrorhamnose 3,5-epimerase
MFFSEIKLKGAYVIDIDKHVDQRGFFARTWCMNEFAEHNLNTTVVQTNIGFSPLKGTLRGLHYQKAPYEEAKLVRCTSGSLYDVILDLRKDSPTFGQWFGLELSSKNHKMLYVPEGFAHGYLTLEEDTELFYQTSQFYDRDSARGVRYNDPAFHIKWPISIQLISENDLNWPDYSTSTLAN